MKVWLSCFFVLFAIAELFQWLKHLALPLPIHILGGAFLAIASNYNKHSGFFFQNSSEQLPSAIDNLSESQFQVSPQQPKSISFTIKRPDEQK